MWNNNETNIQRINAMENKELTVYNNALLQTIEAESKQLDFLDRRARMLMSSNLVPKNYRLFNEVKEGGRTVVHENQSALANCVIAMEIARRLDVSDLMVMQNLHIIEGRPSWSSKWLIAAINNCGRFEELSFEEKDLGEKDVDYQESVWENGSRRNIKRTIKINNRSFVAVTKSIKTGKDLRGPEVTVEMAVKEGWYTKNGSKWPNMPQLMGMYRSAAFFHNLHCPEISLGFKTLEEEEDMLVATMDNNGNYSVDDAEGSEKSTSVEKLKDKMKRTKEAKLPSKEVIDKSERVVDAEFASVVNEKNPEDLVVDAQESDCGYEDKNNPEISSIEPSSVSAQEYSFE